MKTSKEFVHTLCDTIRRHGAMDKLISDRAEVETSNKVLDILRNYFIGDWQSAPHNQHQNPAERRYQTIKRLTNTLLDRTGAPSTTWLLAICYVVYILNITSVESLNWRTPHEALYGQTPDISNVFQFEFWEPVYFATGEALGTNTSPKFPSETHEKHGRFVGFAETVGNTFTYKILTSDTNKILYRSAVRSARDTVELNRRSVSTEGETNPIEIVKSPCRTLANGETIAVNSDTFDPDELIGRTYLQDVDENGERHRAKIVQKIIERDKEARTERTKFLVTYEGHDKSDEIVDYTTVADYLQKQIETDNDPSEQFYKFKEVVGHQGPLKPGDPDYKGSRFNLMTHWEDGSYTYEPLSQLKADDPVTVALYAKQNGLLDEPGFKSLKKIANREKKMLRMLNQSKLKSYRRAPIYKYGFRVPRNASEVEPIDTANNNRRWQDAIDLEISQLQDYNTFQDKGKGAPIPKGYKQITVHLVFDVKHDGRHKARLVAGGHLTDDPIESVYSSVVSLRSLRIVIFLAELNQLELWGADVGNAYLEAYTKEKVCFIAGAGFGELIGHTLIIVKALYGLKSSGLRWHERFADTLREMNFEISKADPDVWMRLNGDVWEYIAVYVDDLCIAAKNPQEICDTLTGKYKYKLKGVGILSFHLGCDFFRDHENTLCFGPKKYIRKMLESYKSPNMFNESPHKARSPLEKGDHPELDDSDLCSHEDVKKYQSMIGALQWLVSLGRFDIQTAVMSMSRFRAEPRIGHLERVKRIYGYLASHDKGAIRVRTDKPDYSELPDITYDWMYTVYGNVREHVPDNLPKSAGNSITLTTYVDANLYHDYITGRAVTGILHLLNQTPIDWYSKRQATVETATYGSEFVAARIATDQVIDLRMTLRYLGVPVEHSTYMFGDNESVVTSSTIPYSALSKRHNALSYHRVREAIAGKIIRFFHIRGENNPADIVSKHWGQAQVWQLIRPLLFYSGETTEIPDEKGQDKVTKEKNLKQTMVKRKTRSIYPFIA